MFSISQEIGSRTHMQSLVFFTNCSSGLYCVLSTNCVPFYIIVTGFNGLSPTMLLDTVDLYVIMRHFLHKQPIRVLFYIWAA